MVEKEVQVPKERPLVAAVIYNRLKAGLPLGIDATIRYGLDIPTVDLPVGACASARWWEGEPLDATTQVDCDDGHNVEVMSRETLTQPWLAGPHDADVQSFTTTVCDARFEAYVGTPWELSADHDHAVLLPDEQRWAAGDRELICLVTPYLGGDLVGTARDRGP
jgi:hypothetical protein